MASISERAAVAVQTVYFVFRTKAELLGAAIDMAVMGRADPHRPEDQAWFVRSSEEGSIAAALTGFVAGCGNILENAAALSEVTRAAAPSDAEVGRVYERREALRVEGYRAFVSTLVGSPGWPAEASAVQMCEVLLTMTGSTLYRSYRADRGWSHERTMEWLVREVPRLVAPWAFGPPKAE